MGAPAPDQPQRESTNLFVWHRGLGGERRSEARAWTGAALRWLADHLRPREGVERAPAPADTAAHSRWAPGVQAPECPLWTQLPSGPCQRQPSPAWPPASPLPPAWCLAWSLEGLAAPAQGEACQVHRSTTVFSPEGFPGALTLRVLSDWLERHRSLQSPEGDPWAGPAWSPDCWRGACCPRLCPPSRGPVDSSRPSVCPQHWILRVGRDPCLSPPSPSHPRIRCLQALGVWGPRSEGEGPYPVCSLLLTSDPQHPHGLCL